MFYVHISTIDRNGCEIEVETLGPYPNQGQALKAKKDNSFRESYGEELTILGSGELDARRQEIRAEQEKSGANQDLVLMGTGDNSNPAMVYAFLK